MITARSFSALVFACLSVVLLAPGVSAQDASSTEREALVRDVRLGVALLSDGSPSEAQAILQPVFEAVPGLQTDLRGSVAYWLGVAYERQGRPSAARRVWKEGLRAMASEGRVEPRLADHYLRSLMAQGTLPEDAREAALWTYRRLLDAVGTGQDDEERRRLRRHVAQTALVMPDQKVRHHLLAEGELDDPETWAFVSDAGTYLVQWWRGQDPVLKTDRNERLEEHLERLAYAQARYRHEERVTNLDDRGHTYLRFGAPLRVEQLTFNEFQFNKDVFRFGVPVTRSDFPANEIWIYHNIDSSGYYIFVRASDGSYRLGSARDLIPARLRHASGRTKRQVNMAVSGLAAMRYVYEELATLQSVYGPYYSEVNNYILQQEEKQIQRSLGVREGWEGQRSSVGEGRTSRAVTQDPSTGLQLPTNQLQETLTASAQAEERAEKRRENQMPAAHTSVLGDANDLPVVMRSARFLNEEGTTDVEVYWALPPGALTVSDSARMRLDDNEYDPSGPFLIDFTGVPYDQTYTRREASREQYFVDRPATGETSVFAPKTHRFGGTGRFHVRLQVEQRLAAVRGEEVDAGPRVKVATTRFDSLHALDGGSASTLEMSDLRPMTTLGSEADRLTPSTAAPHPFATLREGTPLLIYFELYHLGYDENNQTQYTIEYEVRRRTEDGQLGGLWREEDETRTATETSYSGSSRDTDEYIILDWDQKPVTEVEKVTVLVTVTDEVTEEQITREVNLRLVPSRS